MEPKLITNQEYSKLTNPQFIGQTRPDKEGFYQMHWENNGIKYYTINKIHNHEIHHKRNSYNRFI
jgi:hypothetical protein